MEVRMKHAGTLLLALAVPTFALAQVTITGSSRRLTTDPAPQYDPAISGNIVSYTDLRNGNAEVYYFDLVTGVEHRVTTTTWDNQLADVSGNTIAYTSFNTSGAHVNGYTVGGSTFSIANTPGATQMNPGIGGDIVAWRDSRSGGLSIYGKSLSAGTEKRVSSGSNDDTPNVSNGVVVYSSRGATTCQVFVTNFATGVTTQITNSATGCNSSTDISGNIVVFQAARDADQDIYVYNLATARETRVSLPGLQRNPHVSGDWVAFEDVATATSAIKLYHVPSGTVFTAVASTTSNAYLNDIDGTRVAYTGDAAANLDIYLYEFTATVASSGSCDDEEGDHDGEHQCNNGEHDDGDHDDGDHSGGDHDRLVLGKVLPVPRVLATSTPNLTVRTDVYSAQVPTTISNSADPSAVGLVRGNARLHDPAFGCSTGGRGDAMLLVCLLGAAALLLRRSAARARVRRR
jgi:beta propeller repeat protein